MPGTAYPDSSFLVSIYRRDGNHVAATGFMARFSPQLIFLPLHRVELRNALRFAEKLGLITGQERRQAFRQIEEDLRDGLLMHVNVSWNNVLRRADELSEKYMNRHGQRAVDLLHVAAALECGQNVFLSFDQRQCGLAQATGLRVKP